VGGVKEKRTKAKIGDGRAFSESLNRFISIYPLVQRGETSRFVYKVRRGKEARKSKRGVKGNRCGYALAWKSEVIQRRKTES